jgi:hypothetical protein
VATTALKDTDQYTAAQKALQTLLSPGPNAFSFNAQAYRTFRDQGSQVEFQPLPENELLTQVEDFSTTLLGGELPQDVIDQIQRETAETSIKGGLTGQISRNLTARDLGLTTLDLQTKGASLAAGVADIQIKEAQFNKELQIKTAEYNESLRQWNDKFATLMTESDQNAARIQLAALELESQNRQFIISQETAIMLKNAEFEVPGGQEAIAGIGPTFEDISTYISDFLK